MVSKRPGGGSAFGLGGRCRRGDVRARVGLGLAIWEGFSGGFYGGVDVGGVPWATEADFFACGGS